MSEFLTGLIQVNLAASAAILLILVLRRPVRDLFGAQAAYALWLLAPLIIAISFAPPRPAGLSFSSSTAPSLATVAEGAAAAMLLSGARDEAAAAPGTLIGALWLVGVAAMLGWLAVRQVSFAQRLRLGRAGPAVIGFLRQRIITPDDFEIRFDVKERAVVLAHEAVHLRRHDARVNGAVALVRCLCWFNPMIHLADRLMRLDQELSCDAAVIERHPRARATYARALLKAQLDVSPVPIGCDWFGRLPHPLTQRVAMLKAPTPALSRRLAGRGVLACLFALGGYAAWAAAPAARPVISAPLRYVEKALAPLAGPLEPQRTGGDAPRREAPKPDAAPPLPQADIFVNGAVVRIDGSDAENVIWLYGDGARLDGEPLGKQLWRVTPSARGGPAVAQPFGALRDVCAENCDTRAGAAPTLDEIREAEYQAGRRFMTKALLDGAGETVDM